MYRPWWYHTLFYLLVGVIVVVSIFPFYYALLTSFKSGTGIFTVSYLPTTDMNFSNYFEVVKDEFFLTSIVNSVIVAVSVVALSLLMAVTAAFALSRVRFRGRTVLLLGILSVSMFPPIAVLGGLFEIVRFSGMYNTKYALIFSYTIFTLPFTVWVLTTFMRELPVEIEEAAIVDGATSWQIITRVFLPLLWPAMVTTGLLAFIGAWNEFLFALTFTSSNETRTVPVAISLISGASQFELPWGSIMAASVMVTIPIVLLVIAFQHKIVSGLTAGGVKG